MRAIIAPLLFSLLIVAPAWAQRIKVGEPYPDFRLPRIDDRKPVSLSDFRGKKVLLIHFASW